MWLHRFRFLGGSQLCIVLVRVDVCRDGIKLIALVRDGGAVVWGWGGAGYWLVRVDLDALQGMVLKIYV